MISACDGMRAEITEAIDPAPDEGLGAILHAEQAGDLSPHGRRPGLGDLSALAGAASVRQAGDRDAARRPAESHVGAASLACVDQPLGAQQAERGPDGRTAHAVALGELLLGGQGLTRPKLAALDGAPKPVGDL